MSLKPDGYSTSTADVCHEREEQRVLIRCHSVTLRHAIPAISRHPAAPHHSAANPVDFAVRLSSTLSKLIPPRLPPLPPTAPPASRLCRPPRRLCRIAVATLSVRVLATAQSQNPPVTSASCSLPRLFALRGVLLRLPVCLDVPMSPLLLQVFHFVQANDTVTLRLFLLKKRAWPLFSLRTLLASGEANYSGRISEGASCAPSIPFASLSSIFGWSFGSRDYDQTASAAAVPRVAGVSWLPQCPIPIPSFDFHRQIAGIHVFVEFIPLVFTPLTLGFPDP
ncbi:hypothetical protein MSAN_01118500 [Mycena sanguinolenta]|uniref:Uncharacterized protein n=1 Tax=Mycena sanguinolenta TaxID=230812 RepID=A0A8H6YGP1_9AGAR|nr:hypothetical protein MSAN_01118500 [Mycena sanguinolenta]